MAEALLDRLNDADMRKRVGAPQQEHEDDALSQFVDQGVCFVSSNAEHEAKFDRAVRELLSCIKPIAGGPAILQEGGIYYGCWLESTGTINTELLSRFMPRVATDTLLTWHHNQRTDGLIPYKIAADGPVFSQIQMVTPLARTVWNHYALTGRDKNFLSAMYGTIAQNDNWLARHRDTRNTGGVEAFCCYDTGHDLSARFWHVPDSPHQNDPALVNPDHPTLPFVAPDMTANVACQRRYLAQMARELGEDIGEDWVSKADASERALFEQCFDAADEFFYDRDRLGRHVKIQSDNLLRVLACEIGDDALFARSLDRYLLNTRKFFAKYPFTSIALDDPRFDPNYEYNSWCGPSNMLTAIRAPHAFEHHGRHVELTWALYPLLVALFKMEEFAQTVHPFTGRAGFTKAYSPTILALLDFIERLCGILPRPDGDVWFTGLVPVAIEHRETNEQTGYARRIDGADYKLINTPEQSIAYRNSELLFEAPSGLRVITDRTGRVSGLIGMRASTVTGTLRTADTTFAISVGPNEHLSISDRGLVSQRASCLTPPSY